MFVSTLVLVPHTSSLPIRADAADHERRLNHKDNGYSQYLLSSPSNGNNFIMQSNSNTIIEPMIMGNRFHPAAANYSSDASLSTAAMLTPPPAPSLPANMLQQLSHPPAPPPLPANFFDSRTSPWSTLKLRKSHDIDPSRTETNSSKYFKKPKTHY
jgi:hypothetical protein